MAYMSANSYLALCLEATRGTAAASGYTPVAVTTPQLDPMVVFLKDGSFRGSPVEVYDQVAGTWHSEVTIKGFVYTDSIPLLLIGAIGPDVPTGGAGAVKSNVTGNATASVPLTVVTGVNDTFVFTPISTGLPENFTIAAGTYTSVLDAVNAMNAAVGSLSGELFDTKVTASVSGASILLTANVAGTLHNGDTITEGVNDVAADLGFSSNPNTFALGTNGTSYSHIISLENDITTGSQPSSLTADYNDGANVWQVPGAQVADIEFTGGADKALEWSSKLIGNPWNTTSLALTTSTVPFLPGWNTVIDVNSSSLDYIADWTVKIDRKTAPIFTAGQQKPLANFAGPITVSGTFTYVVDSASDPFAVGGSAYALYRSASPIPVTLTTTSTVDGSSIEFQMSNVQFQDVKRSTAKAYTEGTVAFTANANPTDAITGYSPIVATVNNAVASYVAS